MSRDKPPCWAFRKGKCKLGAKCPFGHTGESKVPTSDRTPKPSQSSTHSGASSSQKSKSFTLKSHDKAKGSGKSKLQVWQDSLRQPKEFGCFQVASQLVNTDTAICHEIIKTLASDLGLKKIKVLLLLDFGSMKVSTFRQFFGSVLLPFFQTITCKHVLQLASLQTFLGQIYRAIFGPNGQRAAALYATVVPSLNLIQGPSLRAAIKATSTVLTNILLFNGTAESMPCFKKHASKLRGLADAQHPPSAKSSLLPTKAPQEQAVKQSGITNDITASTKQPISNLRVSSRLQQDGPGRLANGQPRHDNDFENIKDIQIMPTPQEILSPHDEYLPFQDPSTWYQSGLQGMLERHFRLLRENAIGPICEVAKLELQTLRGNFLSKKDKQKQFSARTLKYHDIQVDFPRFDPLKGLEFMVSFRQPFGDSVSSPYQRQKWWADSKRLQGDALMCLMSSCGSVFFCTVIQLQEWELKMRERRRMKGHPPDLRDKFTLFSDQQYAHVWARPVNLDTESCTLLNMFLRNNHGGGRSLIEFPNVVVPGFMPTLVGMQELSKNQNLPFSDLLAPSQESKKTSDGLTYIPMPAYTEEPGFLFDLSAITTDKKSLSFNPKTLSKTDIVALKDRSTLDETQASALLHSLSRCFALIQGPPGTGKSFTGISLIKVLLSNKAAGRIGPILLVAYTNHALDQVGEALLRAGIDGIVRLGSRTQSKLMAERTLPKLLEKASKTKAEKALQKSLRLNMMKEAYAIRDVLGEISHAGSAQSVRIYLERTNPSHLVQLFGGVQDDGFQQVKHSRSDSILTTWLRSGQRGPASSNQGVVELQRMQVHTMSMLERQRLYEHWQREISAPLDKKWETSITRFVALKRELDRSKDDMSLRVLDGANVICVTTSGLAMRHDLLRRLRSKVLLVEEAGEVLESNLITTLLPSIQHAILIGDHQQLKPHCEYHLSSESKEGQRYAMDQSLFERLVSPTGDSFVKLPFSRLEIQRRMRPEISRLVRDTMYPTLIDASPDYPEVVGMKKSLFWFDHRESEAERDLESTSYTNEYEIEMVTALVSHLVKQGVYKAGNVAVLTPYLGQLKKLQERMENTFDVVLGERDLEELENNGIDSTNPEADPESLLGSSG